MARHYLDSVHAFNKNLTPIRKKYAHFIGLIEKMKKDSIKVLQNNHGIEERYKTIYAFVDDYGRIGVRVILKSSSVWADTAKIIDEISTVPLKVE